MWAVYGIINLICWDEGKLQIQSVVYTVGFKKIIRAFIRNIEYFMGKGREV